MLPDMMHLSVIIGLVITMMAMLSHLTFGYRVYQMSDMGQALNYWMQFILLSPDPKCVRLIEGTGSRSYGASTKGGVRDSKLLKLYT